MGFCFCLAKEGFQQGLNDNCSLINKRPKEVVSPHTPIFRVHMIGMFKHKNLIKTPFINESLCPDPYLYHAISTPVPKGTLNVCYSKHQTHHHTTWQAISETEGSSLSNLQYEFMNLLFNGRKSHKSHRAHSSPWVHLKWLFGSQP